MTTIDFIEGLQRFLGQFSENTLLVKPKQRAGGESLLLGRGRRRTGWPEGQLSFGHCSNAAAAGRALLPTSLDASEMNHLSSALSAPLPSLLSAWAPGKPKDLAGGTSQMDVKIGLLSHTLPELILGPGPKWQFWVRPSLLCAALLSSHRSSHRQRVWLCLNKTLF